MKSFFGFVLVIVLFVGFIFGLVWITNYTHSVNASDSTREIEKIAGSEFSTLDAKPLSVKICGGSYTISPAISILIEQNNQPLLFTSSGRNSETYTQIACLVQNVIDNKKGETIVISGKRHGIGYELTLIEISGSGFKFSF
jgi:hypothetical protein